MFSNTSGADNTAVGDESLEFNVSAVTNAALGVFALQNNDSSGSGTADFNTAVGGFALRANVDGTRNTAVGAGAMESANGGNDNTAVGELALANVTSDSNTGVGQSALQNDASGPFNTAVGFQALMNATANANAAFGDLALVNVTSGFFNTGIGAAAGFNQTTGHNNVYIGQGSFGVAGENNTCYIQGIAGSSIPTGNAAFVFVDITTGQLATILVNADGNRVTVPISLNQLQAAPQGKYETVPQRSREDGRQAMLDESLKQQKRIAELEGTVERLSAMVNEQAAQIQRVSAELEVIRPAPKVVANRH
jgi:hypothetical protein